MTNRVNLLILGAGRSGTTTFCKYLEHHPEIEFSNIKEVHYFSQEDLYDRGDEYLHNFFSESDRKIWATADTYLLIDYASMERIKAYNPNMKFVVLLRNPVDRAFSSFNYSKNFGYQQSTIQFKDLDEIEAKLLDHVSIVQLNNKAHLYAGLYHKHLSEWTKMFSKDQFFITSSESFWENPLDTMNRFCEFAKIEPFESLEKMKLNKTAKAKFPLLEQFLLNRELGSRKLLRNLIPSFVKDAIIKNFNIDRLHAMNRVEVMNEKLSDADRQIAEDYFKNDTMRLKETFGISFGND